MQQTVSATLSHEQREPHNVWDERCLRVWHLAAASTSCSVKGRVSIRDGDRLGSTDRVEGAVWWDGSVSETRETGRRHTGVMRIAIAAMGALRRALGDGGRVRGFGRVGRCSGGDVLHDEESRCVGVQVLFEWVGSGRWQEESLEGVFMQRNSKPAFGERQRYRGRS